MVILEASALPLALASESGTGDTLAEIVVTAEKRQGTVQTTPISMTALTGQELADEGITDVADAMNQVPGVAAITGGPGQTQYEIRGLSSDGGESPTVGFYLNDVPITPPTTSTNGKVEIDPNLYDVARIEVLRGPQGTLYGAGSMGGTIKVVTNEPNLRAFATSGESTVSGTQDGGVNYAQNAMANLPLMDGKAALRLVGSYSHTSGWIDRKVLGNFPLETNPDPAGIVFGLTRGNVLDSPVLKTYSDVNDETLEGGRASVLVNPTEALSLTAGVFFQRIQQGGPSLYDSVPGTEAHYQPFDIAEPDADTFRLYSLTTRYDFGPIALTAPTGLLQRFSSAIQDTSENFQEAMNLPSYYVANGGWGAASAFEADRTRQFTQELRLSSNYASRLQWIVGLYYSNYKFFSAGGSIFPAIATVTNGATDQFFYVTQSTKIDQKAVFANASYWILHDVRVTGGARVFSYRASIGSAASGLAYTGNSTAQTNVGTGSNSGVTPLLNIEYTPTDASMMYATASKGYREGNGNFPIPTGSTGVGPECLANLQALGLSSAPSSFGPDTAWNYELGEKSMLLHRSLIMNADVYYIDWSGTQQPVALDCGLVYTANGANAAAKGAELELDAAVMHGWRFTQSVGYSHAVFTTNDPASQIALGQRLLNSPEWTIYSKLEYTRALGATYTLTASLSNSYVSSSTALTYTISQLPSHDLADFRVGLGRDNASVVLFVDNLADRRFALDYPSPYGFAIPTFTRVTANQPRTIGLDVNYHF